MIVDTVWYTAEFAALTVLATRVCVHVHNGGFDRDRLV